jgi:hypothetical protein
LGKEKMATRDAIRQALQAFEKGLTDAEAKKLTMAEYIKLLQLSQELAEDEPKEIKVEWIEAPKSAEA